MFNQHAKRLKTTSMEIPWRRPIASLDELLTLHVWRQDHKGFSHQDPGFIDHLVDEKADIIHVHLPPGANMLLAVADQRACARLRMASGARYVRQPTDGIGARAQFDQIRAEGCRGFSTDATHPRRSSPLLGKVGCMTRRDPPRHHFPLHQIKE